MTTQEQYRKADIRAAILHARYCAEKGHAQSQDTMETLIQAAEKMPITVTIPELIEHYQADCCGEFLMELSSDYPDGIIIVEGEPTDA